MSSVIGIYNCGQISLPSSTIDARANITGGTNENPVGCVQFRHVPISELYNYIDICGDEVNLRGVRIRNIELIGNSLCHNRFNYEKRDPVTGRFNSDGYINCTKNNCEDPASATTTPVLSTNSSSQEIDIPTTTPVLNTNSSSQETDIPTSKTDSTNEFPISTIYSSSETSSASYHKGIIGSAVDSVKSAFKWFNSLGTGGIPTDCETLENDLSYYRQSKTIRSQINITEWDRLVHTSIANYQLGKGYVKPADIFRNR